MTDPIPPDPDDALREFTAVCDESEQLASDFYSLLSLPRYDDTDRVRVSDLLCSLSTEHWDAARGLFSAGMLPSALVVHRAQFEALVRSIWALYVATDDKLSKLSADLTIDTEQSAKNLPSVNDMMQELSTKGPVEAYGALSRFKTNSWRALNSYTHAGIHPVRRHEDGYPVELLVSALRNANGLGVFSGMQMAVLSGIQPLQRQLLDLAARYPRCMPPLLDARAS